MRGSIVKLTSTMSEDLRRLCKCVLHRSPSFDGGWCTPLARDLSLSIGARERGRRHKSGFAVGRSSKGGGAIGWMSGSACFGKVLSPSHRV
jgi:hypothetical protein